MSSTISAGITTGTAIAFSGDTSGALVLQTNGTTTAVTISTAQVVTLAQPLPVASGGTGLTAVPHTVQTFTSGSGTYTLPANCKAIKVTMCGGGGGGAGGGTSPGTGGTGGTTTFGTSLLTCVGGNGSTNYAIASGGASTLNSPAVGLSFTGETSSPGTFSLVNAQGANGGATFFGGGGGGGNAGASAGNAATGFGGGGGGGGYSSAGSAGAGGGSGGYLLALISSPSATYSYAVGAGSAGGTAGGTGGAGGAGLAGVILVEEYYV